MNATVRDVERLADDGVKVERSTELLGFEDETTCVLARLRCPDGVGGNVYGRGCSEPCVHFEFQSPTARP